MRSRIMKRLSAGVTAAGATAAGLAFLFSGPAWAASSPQPASGTFFATSETVNSVSAAGGNTIVVVTVSGIITGTFDGTFTETDQLVIHPDGSVTLAGTGAVSGTLGTCGTGSAPYATEAQGTASARSGSIQSVDQAASTSTPMMISTVDSFTVNAVTGEGSYTGTYHCT
jgi:hypothetical protein